MFLVFIVTVMEGKAALNFRVVQLRWNRLPHIGT